MKLAPHSVSASDLEILLSELEKRKQLSEEGFAEERARRLSRKYGPAKIRQDLRAKGVSSELIARVSSAGEFERARAILEKKFPVQTKDLKERARRMRFLQARGFASE